MASPEVSSGRMISPEVFRELTAVPFEAMADLSMMKLSDAMLVEISKVAFAKMALPEMMTPAVFKMAPVGKRGIIPVGGTSHLDIVASISEIIITAIRSRCIIKYFFGPFYCLLRFAAGLL
jgi:hypothetical protein